MDVGQLMKVAVDLGTDKAFDSLGGLLRVLSEQRAKLFVRWLSDESVKRKLKAEEVVGELLRSPRGVGILRHVSREVLLGTDSISLAAAALVASRAAADPLDPFWSRAARAFDGLANDDALVFLAVMRNCAELGGLLEWRRLCSFDVKQLDKPIWEPFKVVAGLEEEQFHVGIDEAVQRGFFLPDKAGMRLGGTDDLARSAFYVGEDTSKYFELLTRALELAEPKLYGLYLPLNFDAVSAFCSHRATERARPGGGTPPP